MRRSGGRFKGQGEGPISDQPIEEIVRRFQDGQLPRRRLVALLAAAGASAAGIATVVASAQAQHRAAVEQHNIQLHQQHVTQRAAGAPPSPSAQHDPARAEALSKYLADYADDAVVDDPMLSAPVVGKAAIGARRLAEWGGIAAGSIEVVSRFARGDQVVAEWVLSGTHQGEVHGHAPTGREVAFRGVTVVTRSNGKITRESHYYDVAEVHRQLA